MDAFQEKKWFIYIGDHHEGPFSPEELQEKFKQGQINPQSFAWCDGMSDWKQASDMPELAGVFQQDGGTSTRIAGAEGTIMAQAPSLQASPVASVTSISAAKNSGSGSIASQPTDAGKKGVKTGGKSGMSKGFIVVLTLVLVIGGAVAAFFTGALDPALQGPGAQAVLKSVRDVAGPTLVGLVDRFPALAKVYSPIAQPEGVPEGEWLDLQGAAIGAPATVGPKVGVTAGQADPTAPVLYVSSNLPDGAVFDLQIDGVSDTLLNQLAFSTKTRALLNGRFATTPVIRASDGKPVPRGEYVVTLFEADQQPEAVKALLASMPASSVKVEAEAAKGRKLILRKTFFLGGKKDAVYQTKLKAFQDQIREKAKKELEELKQFSGTVESQLVSSLDLTQKLKAPKVSKGAAKSWGDFHTKWTKLDAELSGSFQKWTPESLAQEFFYGAVYTVLVQAYQAVQRAHGVHHGYFSGAAPDLKSFEIQLGEANSAAQAAITLLKTKIEQAEKIPPGPSGMPRRDGL